jgi:hypothetical protein
MTWSRNLAFAVAWLACSAVLLVPHAAPGQERPTR